MQKLAFSLLLCCFTLQSYAKVEPLKGFHYASEQAPKGNEWESPDKIKKTHTHHTPNINTSLSKIRQVPGKYCRKTVLTGNH